MNVLKKEGPNIVEGFNSEKSGEEKSSEKSNILNDVKKEEILDNFGNDSRQKNKEDENAVQKFKPIEQPKIIVKEKQKEELKNEFKEELNEKFKENKGNLFSK